MAENYKKALAEAQKELASLEIQSAHIDRRKAQLEQTIIGLKTLMGVGFGAEERSLTDGIRLVVKASDRFMGTHEILEHLRMLYPNFIPGADKLKSVSTILNRLARDREVIQGKTEDGKVGYMWNRDYAARKERALQILKESREARESKRAKYRPALAQDEE